MNSIESIYKAKLAARDKLKLAEAKKQKPAPPVDPESLPSVELPAPYNLLGMKLAAGRCTYYAAYNHPPTAKGQSTIITHLAKIEMSGPPLIHARHKLSWFAVNSPGRPQIVSDVLDENRPSFECFTPTFMFHNKEVAIQMVQRVIQTQLAD